MSKLISQVPYDYNRQALAEIFRKIDDQVNRLSEGNITASYNAYTAAPTTGTHAVGDFIRHSAPAEAGAPGAKYVTLGFICTVSGTPGTWLSCRVLTGN